MAVNAVDAANATRWRWVYRIEMSARDVTAALIELALDAAVAGVGGARKREPCHAYDNEQIRPPPTQCIHPKCFDEESSLRQQLTGSPTRIVPRG